MRIITSYAYTLDVETAEEAALRFEIYRGVMNDWLRDQGIGDPRADSPADTYVQLTRRDVAHEEAAIDGFLLKQPILESSHLLHTRFDLAVADRSLALFLQFSLERKTSRISPASYPVSCPRALQTILDAGNWRSGQARVRPHSRQLFGQEAGASLRAEIEDPDRTLPIVLMANFPDNRPIGEYQELIKPYDENEWEDFVNRVEDDLGGVALLVELDSASDASLLPPAQREPTTEEPQAPGSLRISKRPRLRSGRRRAMCGAVVRIVWPLGTDEFDQHRHPAWAPYELFANEVGIFFNDDGNNTEPPEWMGTFERDQLMLLRRFVRDKIYEQAALQPVPKLVSATWNAFEQAERKRLADSDNWEQIAKSYERDAEREKDRADNAEARVGSLEEQNSVLNKEINRLQRAQRSERAQLKAIEPILPFSRVGSPRNVLESLQLASNECQNLLWGKNVTDSVSKIESEPALAEKTLRALRALDEGTRLGEEEQLGNSLAGWVYDKYGIECSPDSEERQFLDHNGASIRLSLHLKLKEATAANKAVRIYFEHRPEQGKTLIGYIGPHL